MGRVLSRPAEGVVGEGCEGSGTGTAAGDAWGEEVVGGEEGAEEEGHG